MGNGASNGSVAGNIVNNAAGYGLVFHNTGSQTYSGNISGNGAIQMAGSGTQILSGTNSYASGAAINSGTLEFASTASLPTTPNATIYVNGGTFALGVGGSNGFTNDATGTQPGSVSWVLAGSASKLWWSSNTALGLDTANAVGGTFSYSGDLGQAYAANTGLGQGGVQGLVKLGAGTLYLNGSNSFTGPTTVTAGMLAGSGTLSSATVNVQSGANIDLSTLSLASASTLNLGSAASSAGVAFDWNGSGLQNANNTSGLVLNLSAGGAYVTLNGMATAPTTAATYALLLYSSSSSALAGSFSFAGTGLSETLANGVTGTLQTIPGELELVIGSAALTAGNVLWSGTGSGNWSDTTKWAQTRVPGLSVPDTAVFGGSITSNAATITLDEPATLGGMGFNATGGGSYTITRAGGDTTSLLTLAGTATSFSLANSAGNNTIAVPLLLQKNLSVTAATGSTLTLSGTIGDNGAGHSLALSGDGALILTGSNNYTGGTSVGGGVLALGSSTALPSGTGLYVAAGATVYLGEAASGYASLEGSIGGGGPMPAEGPEFQQQGGARAGHAGLVVGGGRLRIGRVAEEERDEGLFVVPPLGGKAG